MRFGEVELGVRFGTKTVIDAVRDDRETERGLQRGEHVEERHRIGTSARRDEDALPALDLDLARERALREREERRRVRAFRRAAHAASNSLQNTTIEAVAMGNR